jgi:branched-chain amino acid transport system ATP-binding protein
MISLRLDKVTKHFGRLAAVVDVSMEVAEGERRAIIGPNGAGKTTLFNLISGELPPTKGEVYFREQPVHQLPSYERACLGMGRTFQRNNLFNGLTVFENVRLAIQRRQAISRRPWRPAGRYSAVEEQSAQLLEDFALESYADVVAANLSYGVQRQVEVAMTVALRPRLLLLDEPTAGMSPSETATMTEFIERLPRDITILIVEHDLDVIFCLADRITVLHYGRVIADGPAEEVKGDPHVQEVYLGEGSDSQMTADLGFLGV